MEEGSACIEVGDAPVGVIVTTLDEEGSSGENEGAASPGTNVALGVAIPYIVCAIVKVREF